MIRFEDGADLCEFVLRMVALATPLLVLLATVAT